ncbi:hypothetical protein EPR50_G00028290 [Perca flavescens]|uniref:DNAX-activation protein 10 n=1 Tax=Perca flavescens TaxID=8167 RepID=A0A484DK90_PERFV|nr:hypothetical protein EPR50_G00028290 [Perca flavescens]
MNSMGVRATLAVLLLFIATVKAAEACENCFELDSFVVGLAIVVDVLGTAFVMMVIYRYTKKKYSAGPSQASKAPARPAGHHTGPPPPQPDYEPLNPHTRNNGAYDVVNRTG